jgi:Flp pilus assembly protein TadG
MITADSEKHPDLQQDGRSARIAAARVLVKEDRGAALVEFALVLPILLAVVFGIAQFGLAFNSANDETHLANEVARYATVNEDPSSKTLQEWGKSQADSKALSGQTVCIEFPNGTSNIGDPVRVTVSGKINWFPILHLKVTSTTITGSAYMRLETPPTKYVVGCQ